MHPPYQGRTSRLVPAGVDPYRGVHARAPCAFSRAPAYRLVRMFSFTGDTVLDPFMGLGTTLVAAAKCGRNGIGVEIDP